MENIKVNRVAKLNFKVFVPVDASWLRKVQLLLDVCIITGVLGSACLGFETGCGRVLTAKISLGNFLCIDENSGCLTFVLSTRENSSIKTKWFLGQVNAMARIIVAESVHNRNKI